MKKPFILSAFWLLFTFGTLYAQSHKIWWAPILGGSFSAGSILTFNMQTNSLTNEYDFGIKNRGNNPLYGPLTPGFDGCLYGTTFAGGDIGPLSFGNIFKYCPLDSSFQNLYDFSSINGEPLNGLIIDSSNNILGVSFANIYKFNASSGQHNVLHQWNNATGDSPQSGVMQASNGLLYGVTSGGGLYDNGVLYSFDTILNTYTVLHNFPDHNPVQTPIEYSPGILIGVTPNGGGVNSGGEIYQYNLSSGIYTSLYPFNSALCYRPLTSIIRGTDGKLYGTAFSGGTSNLGALFSYDVLTNQFTLLYSFQSQDPFGYKPASGLYEDSVGVFYGTTLYNNPNLYGSIYKYNNNNSTCTLVHTFEPFAEGKSQQTSFVRHSDNRIYAYTAGSNNYFSPATYGTVFSINPITDLYQLDFYFEYLSEGQETAGGVCLAQDGNIYGVNNYCTTEPVLFKYDISLDSVLILQRFTNIGFNYSAPFSRMAGGLAEINKTIFGSISNCDSFPSGAYYSYDIVNDQLNYLVSFDTIPFLKEPSLLQVGADGFLYGLGMNKIPASTTKYVLKVNPLNMSIDTILSTPIPYYVYDVLFNSSKTKFTLTTSSGGAFNYGQILVYDIIADSLIYTYDVDSVLYYTGTALLINDSTLICINHSIFGNNFGFIYKINMNTSSISILYTFSSDVNWHYKNENYMSDGCIYGIFRKNQTDVLYKFDLLTNTFTLLDTIPLISGINPLGRLQESPLVTILNDEGKENTVAYLFPNPSSSFINIKNTKENNLIKIYDVFGKLVITSKTNQENTRLETGNLAPGLYLIQYIENKKTHTMKMVKN